MLANTVPLAFAGASAVHDAFTGEIPEWLTVPFIVTGMVYSIITGNFVPAFFVTVFTLALGYVLYYTGQLGGGDVLLLAGISSWKPFVEVFVPLPTAAVVFVAATLLSGLFYGALFSLRLGKWFLVLPLFVLPPIIAITYMAVVTNYLGSRYREKLFVREKRVDELVPEDVLAEEVNCIPDGKRVLEKEDIALLKKEGIERVKILENLPRFGPFIFAGLLGVLLLESDPLYLYNIVSIGAVNLYFGI